MVRIIFVAADGTRRDVEAKPGQSVMRAALANGVPGILAECGGAASCATCHIFVAFPGLPPPAALEDEMLEVTAAPRAPDSRLGCQVVVTAAMEGLEVRLPEFQA